MEMHSKVLGGSEPLKKAKGVAKRQFGHQKIPNFYACKAQDYQHEIRIAFFKHDYYQNDHHEPKFAWNLS